MTITEFLLARIAEDEVLARAADASRWRGEDKGITFDMYGDRYDDGEAMARLEVDTHANADLIVEFSPPRVLAECAAKRAIVERYAGDYERVLAYRNPQWEDGMNDDDRINRRLQEARTATGYEAVRRLAAVYADHPDYDKAWAIG